VMHGVRKPPPQKKSKTGHKEAFRLTFEQQLHIMDPLFQVKTWDPVNLESWSQTLKCYFAEGEDMKVTEQELIDFFTTDDYAPEAVVVGYKTAKDGFASAYVHFSTNEACKQARKEKKGEAPASVSEMKIVFTDENKWIRIRDGVRLTGYLIRGERGRDKKAYGRGLHDFASRRFEIADFGTRDNWFYPEY